MSLADCCPLEPDYAAASYMTNQLIAWEALRTSLSTCSTPAGHDWHTLHAGLCFDCVKWAPATVSCWHLLHCVQRRVRCALECLRQLATWHSSLWDLSLRVSWARDVQVVVTFEALRMLNKSFAHPIIDCGRCHDLPENDYPLSCLDLCKVCLWFQRLVLEARGPVVHAMAPGTRACRLCM